jgi:hypothetical protein
MSAGAWARRVLRSRICRPPCRPHPRGRPWTANSNNAKKKEKQREEKNKDEKAYEEAAEQSRPPVRSVALLVAGFALTALVIYVWTFFMW